MYLNSSQIEVFDWGFRIHYIRHITSEVRFFLFCLVLCHLSHHEKMEKVSGKVSQYFMCHLNWKSKFGLHLARDDDVASEYITI